MKTLAIINIAKKQLGMEEDDYRVLLKQTTGKSSLKVMSEAERLQVIEALKQKGFKHQQPGSRAPSKKKYVRLIYVLWREAKQAGAIENGSRQALRAFVQRETKVSDPEFLDYQTASPVIEALKKMIARAEDAREREARERENAKQEERPAS